MKKSIRFISIVLALAMVLSTTVAFGAVASANSDIATVVPNESLIEPPLDPLPTTITPENYDMVKARVTAMREMYDALSETEKLYATNFDLLVFYEELLTDYESQRTEEIINFEARIAAFFNDYLVVNTSTEKYIAERKAKADADTLKAEYDALPAEKKAVVSQKAKEKINDLSTDYRYKIILRGDVNLDGGLTVSDVVDLRKCIMVVDCGQDRFIAGDMDNDGVLTVSDIIALRRMVIDGEN